MAPLRVVTVLLAAFACITLPRLAAGQRYLDYRPAPVALGTAEFPRLELTGNVPIRVSWSRRDLALAGGFVAALLIDAAQTRRLAAGGWREYEETNPILGPRPSVGHLNTYTALSGLTVLGVAAVAPKRARPWILGAALAVEAYALAAMSRNGVAIRIP